MFMFISGSVALGNAQMLFKQGQNNYFEIKRPFFERCIANLSLYNMVEFIFLIKMYKLPGKEQKKKNGKPYYRSIEIKRSDHERTVVVQQVHTSAGH